MRGWEGAVKFPNVFVLAIVPDFKMLVASYYGRVVGLNTGIEQGTLIEVVDVLLGRTISQWPITQLQRKRLNVLPVVDVVTLQELG